ncbi:helix-turn-helix domain-containing protein [Natrinema thermotolerans]|uniref:Helix-turn-helix domain-containing protein n=1 Tax=Natrinema thermotolerans TaxID=121872 RepID=A0AAF0PBW5_9EURY|nr:helix-turn-helix domain-containing protein [Natrinema thermotolerans]QCC57629.1 bacterio-opsin activator [Natrinema thermotolerans]WMT08707.1 helix-turn-helix domain-containing protein [Natrinema thermotolerans]
MKRVRITLSPRGAYAPPIYERLAGGASYLERALIVNWNVSSPPTGFLFRLEGEYRRFEGELADSPMVSDYEVLPITDRACYCFLEGEVSVAARALFENFTRGSLMTVPPIECNDDGTNTFSIVGTETDIQTAVDGVPEGVGVTLVQVGGKRVAADSVVGRLPPRQREAVETALELGYYDVPRDVTTEAVADELDCATATAAEHLQKAESTVMASLLEPRG